MFSPSSTACARRQEFDMEHYDDEDEGTGFFFDPFDCKVAPKGGTCLTPFKINKPLVFLMIIAV